MTNILSINHLQKKYHTPKNEILALKDITLTISNGEYISIVGPSGCGKSTLLSILSGIDKDFTGNIIKDDNCKVGYMLQEDCLFPWLTILDNCLLGLKITNTLNTENINYVKELLITYGLEKFISSYPANLSGGMRQRVLRILYTHK